MLYKKLLICYFIEKHILIDLGVSKVVGLIMYTVITHTRTITLLIDLLVIVTFLLENVLYQLVTCYWYQ